ncbi:hypothetical protein EV2_002434 [Malus domestica]
MRRPLLTPPFLSSFSSLSTLQLRFPENIEDSIGSQPSASSTDLLRRTASASVSLSLRSCLHAMFGSAKVVLILLQLTTFVEVVVSG